VLPDLLSYKQPHVSKNVSQEITVEGTIIIIPADGAVKTWHITEVPTLEFLQKEVGGWLELIPRFNACVAGPCIAFMDEEGAMKDLPVNRIASDLWKGCWDKAIPIRGNVVVIAGDKEMLASL
jgi:Domain of unknown function (DUF3846)